MNRETPTKDLLFPKASDHEFELNSQSSKHTKGDTHGHSPKVKITELDADDHHDKSEEKEHGHHGCGGL